MNTSDLPFNSLVLHWETKSPLRCFRARRPRSERYYASSSAFCRLGSAYLVLVTGTALTLKASLRRLHFPNSIIKQLIRCRWLLCSQGCLAAAGNPSFWTRDAQSPRGHTSTSTHTVTHNRRLCTHALYRLFSRSSGAVCLLHVKAVCHDSRPACSGAVQVAFSERYQAPP
jgi:hypothetical protein